MATLFSVPDSLKMPIIIFYSFGKKSLEFGVHKSKSISGQQYNKQKLIPYPGC
jgi:hypothetical protein